MAEVVYLLGAGFNCSVLDPTRRIEAPLATNFFQVLIRSGGFRQKLDGIRQHIYVDTLLEEIEHYWKLDLDALETSPFDIEQCLTMFESQLADGPTPERQLELLRARYALTNLLLMHLSELTHAAHTPISRQFGTEVLGTDSDVLTFNYDTLAEEALGSASGVGPKPMTTRPTDGTPPWEAELLDADLDASHLAWNRNLAQGFAFDEVALPIAGVSQYVSGDRYYAHPANQLYETHRVLKLHGSIGWQRYTPERVIPPEFQPPDGPPPQGIVLESTPVFWMGGSSERRGWRLEPVVIPPQLYKRYQEPPFPTLWQQALATLSDCETLVVVGYSFPPTDFRVRRLFLEAFSDHRLKQLIVVNPDTAVVGLMRQLTRHTGPVVSCDSLSALYGLPTSWFPQHDLGGSEIS